MFGLRALRILISLLTIETFSSITRPATDGLGWPTRLKNVMNSKKVFLITNLRSGRYSSDRFIGTSDKLLMYTLDDNNVMRFSTVMFVSVSLYPSSRKLWKSMVRTVTSEPAGCREVELR
ncbi:uncharacterized protein OGAPODRAFT_93539 [Ogataea polymorpha]|uniref:uncharacterized protein n=1 Tax=Ogataea polymorpha TaxID=460523 RepID=UPI0007F4E175|nr:uncharacterized protein OGAPODRAFT_93539 [Ogataea polymorpha]OBA16562.1 hypothetical protein OGAPODRAFT_93539 [Ogataea polymorpha]